MSEALNQLAAVRLADHMARGLKRQPPALDDVDGVNITIAGETYLSFASNDYLGFSQHPDVLDAAHDAMAQGAGAGASRYVTGQHSYYAPFEARLAEVKGYEACQLFGSGYLANIGAITTLMGKGDVAFVDRLSHACMWDGVNLSGAKIVPFKHNDVRDLDKKLQKYRGKGRVWVLTETVFSMDGDIAPLSLLHELCRAHKAFLYADDAHGFGITGEALDHASHYVDVLSGTCSKALGGYGGYICGSAPVIELVKQQARSAIFSTALPPSVVAGNSMALELLASDATYRLRPLERAKDLTRQLGLVEAQSPIIPIVVGSNDDALTKQEWLRTMRIWVPAIRPPTVPEGTARLRVTMSALHSRKHVAQLAEVLSA